MCCAGAWDRIACGDLLLADTLHLSAAIRDQLVRKYAAAKTLILLGIEDENERARLLTAGCAEVLPATVELEELAARAVWRWWAVPI